MTSTTNTRRASKEAVAASPAAALRQRRLAVATPQSAAGHETPGCATIPPVLLTKPGSGKAPAHITKLSRLIRLLERPDGATVGMLCDTSGWQAHSVRVAIAGTLKRKGIVVVSEKSGTGPRYDRIGGM